MIIICIFKRGVAAYNMYIGCEGAEKFRLKGEGMMRKMTGKQGVAWVLTAVLLVTSLGALPIYAAEGDTYALTQSQNTGTPAYTGEDIVLGPDCFQNGEKTVTESVEGVLSDGDHAALTATFDAPQTGRYTVSVRYYPLEGTGLYLRRRLLLDGELPFNEASFMLYRHWTDSGLPTVNSAGDELKPRPVEVAGWFEQAVTDSLGLYSAPLEFYIEAGSHTLTLEYLDQPAAIAAIVLSAPETAPDYASVAAGYTNTDTVGEPIRFEAEDRTHAVWRTEAAAGIASDGDPKVSPPGVINIKYNAFGGYAWRSGGQSACWEFTVKTAGYYRINLRVKQSWGGNLPVYRRILVDGELPFAELQEYRFPYSREWYSEVLGNGDGDFLFWLEPGTHSITMTPVMGELAEVYRELEAALLDLSAVVRRVVMITGQTPDPNYDYSIKTAIPDIDEDLTAVKQRVRGCIDRMTAVSGGRSTVMGNQLESVEKQLGEMIRNVERIPRRLTDLNTAVTSLGDWLASLQESPLCIDYFEIALPEQTVDRSHSTFFEKIWATLRNFVNSFFKDYNALGNTAGEAKTTIDVWVGRGKDWAEVIKTLCDSAFTAQSGIAVRMNIIPSGTLSTGVNPLLLAISAGNAPDVALGVASNVPVEYALRNAVADLSGFDGFDQVTGSLLPQVLVPFGYNGGVYGLPETMYFRCMFYRRDIVEEYDLLLPDTWDEMYKTTLPRVYENGMQVYIPGWFDMFLLSNGGTYYTEDGKRSALDTKEAYTAFEQYIETYTVYGAPTNANFFNRFRTGEIPIGLGDYGTYVQLLAAAPELSGRWGIMPLPGVVKADGTVDRSTSGYVGEADIILATSEKKEEAWELIRWWLSADVQTEYGREIEGKLGAQARWATSNVQAFRSLPWNLDDLDTIAASWEFAKETPIVPGSYFTGRHITNAWNRCIINHMDPRESLELCVKEINKELKRRQTQFGIE